MMRRAGDDFLITGLLVWVTLYTKQWYIGLAIFVISLILNYFHIKFIKRLREEELKKLASKLKLNMTPDIMKKINELSDTQL